MADIIPLEKKKQLSEKRKEKILRKRKKQAVRDVFQCMHCPSRCSKCGVQIDPGRKSPHEPYRFCENCSEEYNAYTDHLKGLKSQEYYWYNDSWLAVWKTWLDHKSAIDQHIRSREFVRLLDELNRETD